MTHNFVRLCILVDLCSVFSDLCSIICRGAPNHELLADPLVASAQGRISLQTITYQGLTTNPTLETLISLLRRNYQRLNSTPKSYNDPLLDQTTLKF